MIDNYDTFKMHMRMYQEEQERLELDFLARLEKGKWILQNPKLQVKKLHPDAIVPTRGTPVAAGLDLYALEDGHIGGRCDYDVHGGNRTVASTGIAVALPSGYEGQVRPRSGLAMKHGISIVNTPGTIDEDYRGEIKLLLVNHSSSFFTWKKGDRLAQLVITKANYFEVEEVEELNATDRGEKGFGSTGT